VGQTPTPPERVSLLSFTHTQICLNPEELGDPSPDHRKTSYWPTEQKTKDNFSPHAKKNHASASYIKHEIWRSL